MPWDLSFQTYLPALFFLTIHTFCSLGYHKIILKTDSVLSIPVFLGGKITFWLGCLGWGQEGAPAPLSFSMKDRGGKKCSIEHLFCFMKGRFQCCRLLVSRKFLWVLSPQTPQLSCYNYENNSINIFHLEENSDCKIYPCQGRYI